MDYRGILATLLLGVAGTLISVLIAVTFVLG